MEQEQEEEAGVVKGEKEWKLSWKYKQVGKIGRKKNTGWEEKESKIKKKNIETVKCQQ